MNIRIITFVLSLLVSCLCSWAQDSIMIRSFLAVGGTEDGSFAMELANAEEFTAMEFVLYLPEGMTLDVEHPLDLNPERFPGSVVDEAFIPNHVLNITNPSIGMYYIKLYNTKLERVIGSGGELMTFHYTTSDSLVSCTDSIKVAHAVLAIDSHQGSYPATYVADVEMMSHGDYEDGMEPISNSESIIHNQGSAYDLSGRKIGHKFEGIVIRNRRKTFTGKL